jgi:signal transduction histidine kinase/ActR/RegA family two-component response regulator
MKTTSIRRQTLWIAITPVIMMLVLLGGYVIHSRLADAEENLFDRSQLLARSFASSSEYALFSGNRDLLEQGARSMLDNSEIDAVTVLDSHDNAMFVLARDGARRRNLADMVSKRDPVWQDQDVLRLYQPIVTTQLNIGDIELAADSAPPKPASLGAVVIEVSKQQLNRKEVEMLGLSLLIMLAVLSLSIAAAHWVARRIDKPITAIGRDLQRIGEGALDVRIEVAHGIQELDQLARVVNQMATEIHQSRELLETRIAEATRSLREQKEQLERANQESIAANNAKSNFLANMSHEIRTPMNTIIGMTQLALLNEHDKKRRDYLRKISHSGEHLLGVIDDILDFSKIESGKLVLENTDFDLDQVKQTLISVSEWKASEKHLKLTFDFESSIPHNLHGDPLRVNQILINYINNAIKFTAQGEIIVRARKLEETEHDVSLRFEVQDTGIGISPEQQSKLFQVFQQGDSSISRQYGGTGLGLAITQRLASLMSGEVGVQSETGKGSTFWAMVRISRSAATGRQDEEREKGAGGGAAAAAIRGARILLAEDHPFNQQVAIEFLEDAGATARIANNGEEVLELLQRESFDCVLMDMQMPLMDGLAATRLIRANAALAKVPVIAMTANASHEDRERCLAAGMNDFIVKPFKLNNFYDTIARWVSTKAHESGR